MRPLFFLRWLCLGLAFGFAGCLGGQPAAWQDPAFDLVWPEPPETPRIRFLRILSDGGDFRDQSRSGRLFRWIAGENDERIPLVAPYGVAADGEGRVWVADAGTRSVHLFDLGRGETGLLSGAGKEDFVAPVGVAYDPARRRLYVSDAVLGKVFILQEDGSSAGVRLPSAGFGRPGGMAVGPEGDLYVADVLKGVVEIFSPEGEHRKSLGSAAAPDGRFSRPSNVAIGRDGRIFVADSMNFRVEAFDPEGSALGTIGGLGDVPGYFARPRGIAIDSEGHLYVADAAFDNVQIFDPAGGLLLHFGRAGDKPGRFNLPAGLFVDRQDRLYVVDTLNRRVQIFQYLEEGGGGGK